jgi:hypothetical protein
MQNKPISTILCLLLFFFFEQASLMAQIQTVWLGGTPGRETRWECSKNWKNNKVPDEFSDVLIPDVSSGSLVFPELDDQTVAINSLRIEGGGRFVIGPHAVLTIYNGIFIPSEQSIVIQGSLFILNEHEVKDSDEQIKALAGKLSY